MQKTVRLDRIEPNPFRDLERYRISEEKVASLENSMRLTGVWANIVVRKRSGRAERYELAYGHHRLQAAANVLGRGGRIAVDVQDLDNDTMFRMMADENLREWDADVTVEVETIRAVLQAAGEGKLDDLRPSETGQGTRGGRPAGFRAGAKTYSAQEVARFLGGNWSNEKVGRCMTALRELGDEGVGELEGIKPTMAAEIIRTAKVLAKDEEPSQEAVVKHARDLAIQVRDDRLHRDDLREMAGVKSGRGSTFHTPKQVLHPEDFALKLGSAIGNLLREDPTAQALDEVIEHREQFADSTIDMLAGALRYAATRATAYADRLIARGDNDGHTEAGPWADESEGSGNSASPAGEGLHEDRGSNEGGRGRERIGIGHLER